MFLPEINKNDFKKDKTLHYMYALVPGHPLGNKQGKVYEHIYVACQELQRFLTPDEVVHHIDRNRSNNNWNNLLVLTQREHIALHHKEDNGFTRNISKVCPTCNTSFITTEKINQIFCCSSCASKNKLKFDIDKEELRLAVWQMPTTKVAAIYQVSDVAIAKRCKKLGILKPNRGYWRKVETNKL